MPPADTNPIGLRHNLTKFCEKLRKKASFRSEEKLFVVEGIRELQCAHQHEWHVHALLTHPDTPPEATQYLTYPPIYTCSKEAFEQVAYRNTSHNVVAILDQKPLSLENLSINRKSSRPILLLTGVEKPGNLGAVLRSAVLADAQAVLLIDPIIDVYNPNVVRNSLGGIFAIPIAVCQTAQAQAWLKEQELPCIGLDPSSQQPLFAQPLHKPHALLFGSEQRGIAQSWLPHCTHMAQIPMKSNTGVNSLNLSNSVAIALYEAQRQRYVPPKE